MRIHAAAVRLAVAAIIGSAMPPGAASAQTKPDVPATAPSGSAAGGGTGTAAGGEAQQDFTIVNSTGHTVTALNVSPSDEDSWGENILGDDRLGNGESAQITFPRGETQCGWDIRATYDDSGTTDVRSVNLCEVATVTLTAQ